MSRVIKFRYWVSEEKKMLCHKDLFVADIEAGYIQYADQGYWSEPQYIPMQFTGMKDKNGKEIYEGDIIKYSKCVFDFSKPDAHDSFDEDRMDEIIFVDGQFKASQSSFGYEGEDLIYLDMAEVIGNIYENPELLKQE